MVKAIVMLTQRIYQGGKTTSLIDLKKEVEKKLKQFNMSIGRPNWLLGVHFLVVETILRKWNERVIMEGWSSQGFVLQGWLISDYS